MILARNVQVLHVVPSFYPALYYGGPIYSVRSLCRSLRELDCEIRVLTTDANGPVDLPVETALAKPLDGYSVRYCRRWAADSISPKLLTLLRAHIAWADVVHLTAIYSFPTFPTLALCKLLHKPVIWSPRGALQDWEGSERIGLKRIWDRMCLGLTNKASTVLHVTSFDEKVASENRLPGLRSVVIPNGVDVPPAQRRIAPSEDFRLLFIGRLHIKKGLENLLDACHRLPASLRWRLTIAGTGEPAYVRKLLERIHRLELGSFVRTSGLVEGDAREEVFADADLLIVPSFTENFGQVIAEGLVRGLPVIASKATPWF